MTPKPVEFACRLARKGLLSLLLCLVATTPAPANPQAGAVAAGSATISSPAAGVLEIINDPGTIINWNEFSIGVDEVTRFIQQGASSSVLNRVTGGNPSEILGQLLSNGQVWLINTNGIAFGRDAVVDTAGFVASTLGISDEDYLAGRFELGDGERTGFITNAGVIIANERGSVFLIAPRITNTGVVRADNGSVVLAAGRKAVLTSLEYDHIRFEVQSPGDTAVNLGTLQSLGGAVAAYAGRIDQRGVIQADRVARGDDGVIHLVAGENRVGGTLSVAGGQGRAGGRVRILGDDIVLAGAAIDAGGDAGGGDVLVGGDYQGGGTLPTAATTTMDASSTIDAGARGRGDGGRIVVWSDGHTGSFGRLSARGGPLGGDGGLVETSGKGSLDFGVPADVGAPAGRPGTWLIDPTDIDIDSSHAASIETALNEGSSVSVKTSDGGDGKGDISVNSAIHKTAGGDASLTLDAHNEIHVNADIKSSSDKLDVNLKAGRGINMNASIDTNGGRLSSAVATPHVPDADEDGTAVTEVAPETTAETEGETSPPPDSKMETDEPETVDTDEVVADLSPPAGPVKSAEAGDTGAPADPVAPTETAVTEPASIVDGEPETAPMEASPDTAPVEVAVFDDNARPLITISGDIVTRGGGIDIDSGDAGRTIVSGVLDASNLDEGDAGGDIRVLGGEVLLVDEARLDASGDAGGGDVLVGGDYQGGNDAVRNARHTRVGTDASISADAISHGDGGKVVVWADETTVFQGTISATGGRDGGDGGFAEVSGKQRLGFHGTVDVSAPRGEWGTLLLDPTDVVIGALGTDDGELADNQILEGEGGALFNISAAALAAALAANTLIEAANDITLSGGSPVTWATGSRLTLDAGNDIQLNDDLDGGANGDITLIAGNDIGTTGATISGDDLVLNAGNAVNVSTAVNTVSGFATTGAFDVSNSGALGLGAVSAGGDISIVATGPLTANGTVTATGANSILLAAQGNSAADDLNINARITATTGDIDLYAGDSVLQQTPGSINQGIDTTTGNINIFAGTDYNGGAPTAGTATGTFTQGANMVTIFSPGGDVNISAPGNVEVNRVINDFFVDTSQSSITSDNGSITEQGVFTQIFGPDFTLSAATGIDLTNTPGSGNTNIGTLDASNSTSGDILIAETGSLVVTGLSNSAAGGAVSVSTGSFLDMNTAASSNNGDITLSTSTGDITFTLGANAGGGDIQLSAGGNILSDNLVNPGIALSAANLSLSAPGEISVRTDANTVAAESTTGGNITIVDNAGLATGTVDGITGVSTADGSVSLTADGGVNIGQAVDAGGNGNVSLTSNNAGIVVSADVRSSNAGTGDGNGGIDLQAPNGAVTSGGGRIESAGGALTALAAGNIFLDTQVANIDARSTVAGDIVITEADGVTLDPLVTTASDITVTSGNTMNATSITAGGSGSVFLTANNGDLNVGLITAPGDVFLTTLNGDVQDLQDDLLQDIDQGGDLVINASGVVGGSSPGGSAVDPFGALESDFAAPGAGSTPAPAPLPPATPAAPELPIDDIISQIVSLQTYVDVLGSDWPETDDPISFVEERTQCY